jgi:UDP-glucuronate decarboxylase
MRILVTGGAGFIGSHLCEVLVSQNHDVICIDNFFTSHRENISHLFKFKNFEFFRYDVCDQFHIECNQIYHLACPASPVHYQKNPVRTIKTSVLGTLNALECARDVSARLVIASTSEIYGDPTVHPQVESYLGNVNPIGTRSCYDEGKRVGESLAFSWSQQYKTDVRIARLFNTFGERMAMKDGRLIPNFITQAIEGKDLTVYGDGKQTRSFCYVSDTVSGLIKLMNADRISIIRNSEEIPVFNIGNPDERTILNVANDVVRSFDNKIGVCFEPLPLDDPKQRCPDITKAKELLNWYPKISYEEGMKRTVNWFVDYIKNHNSV